MEGRDELYQIGDVRMRYTVHKNAGGPTFVLLHGIGMGRIVFDGVAEVLRDRGTVLAVDLPGFGDSPEPGKGHDMRETAKVVSQLIQDTAQGPVVLVGHSMGTQIASEVAVHRPELVRVLVLIAPTVNRYERSMWKQAGRMMQDLAGESPKVLLLGMWEYLKTSPLWFVNKLRFMLRHKLELVAPSISVPTLVLRGESDRVCPRNWVQEIAECIPGATMREIHGRGHEAIIKSPEPVASMILDYASNSPCP